MGDNCCMNTLNEATQWLIIAIAMWTGLVASASLSIIWWRKYPNRPELASYGIPHILVAGIISQTIGLILFHLH